MDTSTATAATTVATDTLGRRISPRRHRTIEEKRAIVVESLAPGASVAEVARRHEVNANLVFAWRRLHAQGLLDLHSRRMTGRRLVPVVVAEREGPSNAASATAPAGTLRIELPSGARVHIHGAVDGATLRQVLEVLRP